MTTLPPPLRGTSLKEGGKGAAVTPANPSRTPVPTLGNPHLVPSQRGLAQRKLCLGECPIE